MTPYLSLCMICSDIHKDSIKRLLRSVLDRGGGPLVDEIVIGYNGTDYEAAKAIAAEVGEVVVVGSPNTGEREEYNKGIIVPLHLLYQVDGPVQVRVYQQVWNHKFAAMRQQTFEAATGLWRMYLDGDDILVGATDDQVSKAVVEATGEAPRKHTTFKDLLRGFPATVGSVWLPYHYVVDSENRPLVKQWRRRVVRWIDGWAWTGDVHEDMYPTRGNVDLNDTRQWVPGLLVRHLPVEGGKERLIRNFDIGNALLERSGGFEGCRDPEILYGVGSAYSDMGSYEDAITYLSKAISLAIDPEHIYIYALVLTQNLIKAARYEDAARAAFNAIHAFPDRPMGYFAQQAVAYARGAWDRAVDWYKKGLSCPQKGVYVLDVVPWRGAWPKAVAASALVNVGKVREAMEMLGGVSSLSDLEGADNPGVLAIRDTVIKAFAVVEAKKSVEHLIDWLADNGNLIAAVELGELAGPLLPADRGSWKHGLKLDALRDKIRVRIQDQEVVDGVIVNMDRMEDPLTELRNGEGIAHFQITPSKDSIWSPTPSVALSRLSTIGRVLELQGTDSIKGAVHINGKWRSRIAIACPIFAQWWGPDSPENEGTGGSEEAIVYLTRELARRGVFVEVFGPLMPGDRPIRVSKGVVYRHLTEFDYQEPRDAVIWHRAPSGIMLPGSGAKYNCVWHHDHCYPAGLWTERAIANGFHLWVSDWQRKVLLNGADAQGCIIGNGIPVEQFTEVMESLPERDPYRVVYASLPYRGLDRLLEVWPAVKEAVPEASLHVYYGTETMTQVFGPEMGSRINAIIARANELGVVNHGRLGQRELTVELLKSGVWAYPTNFEEVSCIIGMRALAAGMVPVFGATAALPETQLCHDYMVSGCDSPAEWDRIGRDLFIDNLIRALTTIFPRDQYSKLALDALGWSKVADRLIAALSLETD